MLPLHEYATAPLFAEPSGKAVTTAYARELIRGMAGLIGLPRGLFGSSSLRIGGATDLHDLFGADGERLIRERGRWHSDVATAYQRTSASLHLMASTVIADAAGVDLESFTLGWRMDYWAQPA